MQRKKPTVIAMVVALVTVLTVGAAGASSSAAYDAIPDPLASGYASIGYQATSTSEYGQHIAATGPGTLDSVTVTLVSWACESGQWNLGDCETTPGATFDHPVTINLYQPSDDYDPSDPAADDDSAPGALIGTVTQTVTVPYRPSADPGNCDNQTFYTDDLGCIFGYAFTATFDFADQGIDVPSEFVVGVAYDTQSYGASPIGEPGPYNALNVGIDFGDRHEQPTVGEARDNYWDSTYMGRAAGLRNVGYWDYDILMEVSYAPPARATADDCKDNYADYGFSNTGQCIASVRANANAGK